jgi:ATP-dependent Lhr-like helicase
VASRGPQRGSRPGAARRIRPTRTAPIAIFLREDSGWLIDAAAGGPTAREALSHAARDVLDQLERHGALFLSELVPLSRRLTSEVEDGLWELVAAGLVTADGFDNLRALTDPKRRRGEGRFRAARPRHAAGRWALLRRATPPGALRNLESLDPRLEGNPSVAQPFRAGGRRSLDPREAETSSTHDARAREERAEVFARQLLLRWGIVFRDLVARETIAPPWRELLGALRRLEARGEIRGGRFVSGFLGEQFARPEAIELVRAVRRDDAVHVPLRVAAADPLNLVGIIIPGQRVSASTGMAVDLLGPSDARTGHGEMSA